MVVDDCCYCNEEPPRCEKPRFLLNLPCGYDNADEYLADVGDGALFIPAADCDACPQMYTEDLSHTVDANICVQKKVCSCDDRMVSHVNRFSFE